MVNRVQNNLGQKVESYLKAHGKRRRGYAILLVLSLLITFYVDSKLLLPALSMTEGPIHVEAEVEQAGRGEIIPVYVSAEAPEGEEETAFVLKTMSTGGGLSDEYQFSGTDVCMIETEEETQLELHREISGKGEASYWFKLLPKEKVSFTLHCISDAEVEDGIEIRNEEPSETPDVSEEEYDEEYDEVKDSTSPREEAAVEERPSDGMVEEPLAEDSQEEDFIPDTMDGEPAESEEEQISSELDEPLNEQPDDLNETPDTGEDSTSEDEPELELPAAELDEDVKDSTFTEPMESEEAEQADGQQQLTFCAAYAGSLEKALEMSQRQPNLLTLTWMDGLQDVVLTAETGDVTVSVTGPQSSFPKASSGALTLAVEELEPSVKTDAAFQTLEDAVKENSTVADEQRLFDIRLLDGDIEVEPCGPIQVTFSGLVQDADHMQTTVYHIDSTEEAAHDMLANLLPNGNVSMGTDHFSYYAVVLSSTESLTLDDVLDRLGDANQFAVFAENMDGEGHMEGNIAVKNLTLKSTNLGIGDTDSVYNDGDRKYFSVRVHKKLEGTGGENKTYYFGAYETSSIKDGIPSGSPVKTCEITGEGTAVMTGLTRGTSYTIFELTGQNGKPLANGASGDGFTVSYEEGTVESTGKNNISYIENILNFKDINSDWNFNAHASLKLGDQYKVTKNANQFQVSYDWKTIRLNNLDAVETPTGRKDRWESDFVRLNQLSTSLAAAPETYKITDKTPGLKVLNVPVQSDGTIDTLALVKRLTGGSDGNYLTNNGFTLTKGQYLVVNLDCSQVGWNKSVTLPAIGVNGGIGGWKTDYNWLLWNFVSNGSPYTGEVGTQNNSAGTLFAPSGTIHQNATLNGAVIAKSVVRTSNEIHKLPFLFDYAADTTVTNTVQSGNQSVTVKKVWDDGANLHVNDKVVICLKDQSGAVMNYVTLPVNGKWTYTWQNLPQGAYTVEEQSGPDGYVPEIQVEGASVTEQVFTVTNRKANERIDVQVTKTWVGTDADTKLPDSIQVYLLADGKRVSGRTLTLNKSNGWKGTFTDLPRTGSDGHLIEYSVEEIEVEGYVTTVSKGETIPGTSAGWKQADHFTSGKSYMLVTNDKALNNSRNTSLNTIDIDLNENKQSTLTAIWKATASGSNFTLLNQSTNRNLTLYASSDKYYINAGNWNNVSKEFNYNSSGKLYAVNNWRNYYISGVSNGYASTSTSSRNGLNFTLYEWQESTNDSLHFQITNTKLSEGGSDIHLPHKKQIDAFRDGEDNPDTTLDNSAEDLTDLYRLYLDIQGNEFAQPVDLLLVIDNSGSMVQPDKMIEVSKGNEKTRLEVLNNVLKGENGFIQTFLSTNKENQIATVYFSGPDAQIEEKSGKYYDWDKRKNYDYIGKSGISVEPENIKELYEDVGYNGGAVRENYTFYGDAWSGCKWSNNVKTLEDSLTQESLNGRVTTSSNSSQAGTNYAAGLAKASELITTSKRDRPGHLRMMIFLSDGVPTYYLSGADGLSGTRGGTGYYGNVDKCISPTKTAINSFRKEHSDIMVRTVGFGDDDSQNKRTDLLKLLAGSADYYYDSNNLDELRKSLTEIMTSKKVTGVSITDEISQYVTWYGAQPDVKVTMRSQSTGRTTTLWQGAGEEWNGVIGRETAQNRAVQDGKSIPIIQSVQYTPQAGATDTTTGKVIVKFNPAYELDPDYVYTLSFNVETTKLAYDEYAQNRAENDPTGYRGVVGDDDPSTDYGTNKTSTNKPGFHSNQHAYVNYIKNYKLYEEDYKHPVIQVGDGGLLIRKTDVADERKFLQGAQFDIYQIVPQSEDTVKIPGSEDLYGIKVNLAPLVTDEKGEIDVKNLPPGEYALVETRAPTGYQLLEQPIHFVLSPGEIVIKGMYVSMADTGPPETENGPPVLTVKNTTGFEIPHTGGAGTGWPTAIGCLLLNTAAAGWITGKVRRSGRRGG